MADFRALRGFSGLRGGLVPAVGLYGLRRALRGFWGVMVGCDDPDLGCRPMSLAAGSLRSWRKWVPDAGRCSQAEGPRSPPVAAARRRHPPAVSSGRGSLLTLTAVNLLLTLTDMVNGPESGLLTLTNMVNAPEFGTKKARKRPKTAIFEPRSAGAGRFLPVAGPSQLLRSASALLASPLEVLRGAVHLVVVLAVGEGDEFLLVVGQPRGLVR